MSIVDEWLPPGLKDEEMVKILKIWYHQHPAQLEKEGAAAQQQQPSTPSTIPTGARDPVPPSTAEPSSIKAKKSKATPVASSAKTVTASSSSSSSKVVPSMASTPQQSIWTAATNTMDTCYMRLHCVLEKDEQIDFILCLPLPISIDSNTNSLPPCLIPSN